MDTASVALAERFLPDILPCVVGGDPMVVEGCDEGIARRAGVPPGGGLSYTCGTR